MTQSTLQFLFQKTVSRVIENTVLKYVLVEVRDNVGIPLLVNQIQAALAKDPPEAMRRLLLNALERLDDPARPPATIIMPEMWKRDP